jgi:exosortase
MGYRVLSSKTAAGLAVIAALTLILFHHTLRGLFFRWTDWEDGTYSHGLLVPAFSVFLLFDMRHKLARTPIRPNWAGLAILVLAILMFLAGRLANTLFVQAVAFIVAIAGLTLLAGGWALLKAVALPIGFLVFMCPLPHGFYDVISARLRLAASTASTVILQLARVPAYREGNIIYLPGAAPMSVEDACSGIRSLFSITATAVAFSVLARGGSARKAVLVLSAVPIAVASNILRVTGTGILLCHGTERLAHGFYHYLGGWVLYVVALAALFGEYLLLETVFPMYGNSRRGGGADDIAPGMGGQAAGTPG